MDRLTFDGNFCYIAMCRETPGGSFCDDDYCYQRKVWERLKQYEDTGLEPEQILTAIDMAKIVCSLRVLEAYRNLGSIDHIGDLLQAEQDGRLLVLPCKIGDTLYMIVKKPIPEKGWLRYVRRFRLTYKNLELVSYYFGKRVFLTREEAEAAISSMERKAGAE